MMKTRIKAYLAVIITAFLATLFFIKPLIADDFTNMFSSGCSLCDTNHYLSEVASYTYSTLAAVNNIPALLTPLTKLAEAMLVSDSSDATATFQGDFTSYANGLLNNNKQQLSIQTTFQNDFFTQNGKNPAPTTTSLPFANELTYTTMLNKPFFKDTEKDANGNDVDSALKYVENASGQAIPHIAPGTNWKGSQTNQDKYKQFYQTISAIQTFNTYVMSEMYVNAKNNFNLSNLQIKLMQDASDSDNWFKQVASEEIGIVFRQLLLFTSQIYVVLINLLQTNNNMVQAQAMTNALLIVGNQFTEQSLASNAQGMTYGSS